MAFIAASTGPVPTEDSVISLPLIVIFTDAVGVNLFPAIATNSSNLIAFSLSIPKTDSAIVSRSTLVILLPLSPMYFICLKISISCSSVTESLRSSSIFFTAFMPTCFPRTNVLLAPTDSGFIASYVSGFFKIPST